MRIMSPEKEFNNNYDEYIYKDEYFEIRTTLNKDTIKDPSLAYFKIIKSNGKMVRLSLIFPEYIDSKNTLSKDELLHLDEVLKSVSYNRITVWEYLIDRINELRIFAKFNHVLKRDLKIPDYVNCL